MTKTKHITLNDIASELGISKVAVSKALRDHPDISEATKKRVNETALRLGYVPNFMARNLSSQRSNTIGLVVPKIAHYFMAEVIESIYKTAYENNYEVILTVSQENSENEIKHMQTLLAMRVDGLLISVTEKTNDLTIFDSVKKRNVPLVFFDRVFDNLGFSYVTSDDEDGAFDAVSYLVNAGYKKIAHLGGYSSTNIGRYRMQGFKRAVNKFKLDIPKEWINESGFGEQSGYDGFKKLYANSPLPEVVFTVTHPVALGVITAAEELNIKMPDDLNIMCFGGSNYNQFMKPSLSFVKQPVEDIGKAAVELLISEIKNPDTRGTKIQLPTELVLCETCLSKKGA
jgi:LacI family transcriptional regulator